METAGSDLLRSEVGTILKDVDGMAKEMGENNNIEIFKETLVKLSQIISMEDITEIQKLLKTLGKCLPCIVKGSTSVKIRAVFQIIRTASPLVKVLSPYKGPVSELAVLAISFFGKCDKEDIQTVAEKVILKGSRESEMPTEALGVKEELGTSQAYLNGLKEKSEDLTPHNVVVMMSFVTMPNTVRFLGTLAGKIKLGSDASLHPKRDVIKVSMEALDNIEVYCQLAALRDTILFEMCMLTRATDHSLSEARAINAVIDRCKESDKEAVGFLANPDPENAVVVSLFNPSERPCISQLLQDRNSSFPNLRFLAGKVRMELSGESKMKTYVSKMPTNENHILLTNVENAFYDERDVFELGSLDDDNHFYIRACNNKYMYMPLVSAGMDIRCRSVKKKKATWKVIKLRNGKFVLSTVKWPDWFACGYQASSLYLWRFVGVNGNVGTCRIIPTEMAQWNLVKC